MGAPGCKVLLLLEHYPVVKERIVPFAQVFVIKGMCYQGQYVTVSDFFVVGEEKVEEHGADIGFNEGSRLVESKGSDG